MHKWVEDFTKIHIFHLINLVVVFKWTGVQRADILLISEAICYPDPAHSGLLQRWPTLPVFNIAAVLSFFHSIYLSIPLSSLSILLSFLHVCFKHLFSFIPWVLLTFLFFLVFYLKSFLPSPLFHFYVLSLTCICPPKFPPVLSFLVYLLPFICDAFMVNICNCYFKMNTKDGVFWKF